MAPWPDTPATTSTTSRLTGALHGIGTAETPLPPLNLVGDYGGGGMLLAVGLLSAILEARESGEGQVLDVAMVDGVATLLAPYFGMVPEGTWRDRREDNLLDGAAHFYGAYATADGRHSRSARWSRSSTPSCATASGSTCRMTTTSRPHGRRTGRHWPHVSPKRPATSGSRSSIRRDAVRHRCFRCRRRRTIPTWSRGETFIDVDGVTQPAPAPRFSRTRPAAPTPPSLPGDHTHTLLRELGLDLDTITALEHAGVVTQSKRG